MPFGGAGHLSDHIFHVPGAKVWDNAAALYTLPVTYPFCGSALTDTTDNAAEKKLKTHYPEKIPVFVPSILSLIHI